MTNAQIVTPISLKKVLCLTDFSPSSTIALPFACAVARQYAGSVEVLHVLTPVIPESCHDAVKADEELAEAEMTKIRSQVIGVACETTMARGMGLWEAIDRTTREHHIDLIVAGTHGRTGLQKALLGSVAEEVFRRSCVPVLTVGPLVRNYMTNRVRFDRVLFATDFSSESEAATAYAISLAQETSAHLILLHVLPKPEAKNTADAKVFESSVTKTISQLYQIVPGDAELHNPAEVLVEYGDPADRIFEAAKQQGSDLIVLGVRGAGGHLGAATHLERATAHKVVAHAPCPVLTVRARETVRISEKKDTQMTSVEKPVHRPEHAKQVCNICGKPWPETICETCANWVRAEALDRKKHEEKPNS